jgi:hypothetical protein
MGYKVGTYPEVFGFTREISGNIGGDYYRMFEKFGRNVTFINGAGQQLFTGEGEFAKELLKPEGNFVVAINTSLLPTEAIQKGSVLTERNTDYMELSQKVTTSRKTLYDSEGVVLAYYYPELKTVIMPHTFDVGTQLADRPSRVSDTIKRLLTELHAKLDGIYALIKARELFERLGYSKNSNSPAFIESVKRIATKQVKYELEHMTSTLAQNEEAIRTALLNISSFSKTNEILRGKISGVGEVEKTIQEKVAKELELIMGLKDISDVILEEEKLTFSTHYLPLKTTRGEVRAGNCYLVEVRLGSVQVVMKSLIGLGRLGLWSHVDPHPHVNGSNGEGCLGNVASTLAELASAREYFPLVIIILEYLKSANVDDSAGKRVMEYPFDSPKIHEAYEAMALDEFATFLKEFSLANAEEYHDEEDEDENEDPEFDEEE